MQQLGYVEISQPRNVKKTKQILELRERVKEPTLTFLYNFTMLRFYETFGLFNCPNSIFSRILNKKSYLALPVIRVNKWVFLFGARRRRGTRPVFSHPVQLLHRHSVLAVRMIVSAFGHVRPFGFESIARPKLMKWASNRLQKRKSLWINIQNC